MDFVIHCETEIQKKRAMAYEDGDRGIELYLCPIAILGTVQAYSSRCNNEITR